MLIVSAINSVDGVSDYSKADAIVEAQQELSRLSSVKSKEGGKIGPEDAKTLVNEASSIPPLHHPSPRIPPSPFHLSLLTSHPSPLLTSHPTSHPPPQALDMWDTTTCDVPSEELQAAIDNMHDLRPTYSPTY